MYAAPSNALCAFSARIGIDPNHVQGPGGNTSEKQGDTLWVKSSGTWLADATSQPIFVATDHPAILTRLADGLEIGNEVVKTDLCGPNLRPSIEVALHALMPHRVVAHTHSVSTIAISVRRDAPDYLERALAGLSWAFVPYVRPGLPLARMVERSLVSRPDVLVLGNHGLVVGGDDIEAVELLLQEIETRLANPIGGEPRHDLRQLSVLVEGTDWEIAAFAQAHDLAFAQRRIEACAGALYPDHVVFLGPAPVPILSFDAAVTLLAQPFPPRFPAMIVIDRCGVIVRRGSSAAMQEMVRALALVAARLDEAAELVYLTPAQEAELLSWDAEELRQSLDLLRMPLTGTD